MPLINIDFYLTGKKLDFNAITNELGVMPTKTRLKEEWPQISLDMGIAHDSWLFSTNYIESLSVAFSFEDLIDVFYGKKEILKKIIDQYLLECTFVVVIKADEHKKPEVTLTKKCINFASEINAEINFDLYSD